MADLERLVPLREEGTRPPLFCLHAVSGSAYSYTGLVQLLGDDQPVYAFEAPGFDNERAPADSVPGLAAEYAAILREFRPEGGYDLLGWSFGGVLAVEIAQQLAEAGVGVRRLIMVDSGVPWVAELPAEKEIIRRFMADLMGIAGTSAAEVEAVIARDGLSTADEVFAAIEEAEILPEELDAELLGERYTVFRAHLAALFGFEFTKEYSGPVTHIMAGDESLRQYMRWEKVTPELTERTVPGTDHHSIWSGGLTQLSEIVRATLAEKGTTL
ncbi:alpha/beta fold hydrolase [Longispora albida]|uniref:thioesterase domain-containing protein n=1 Tax=Longispora albida TaxID=203523 RepID=UPI00037F08C4|nr:alpha/beta fold hydrolase [Longispora albida]